MTLTTTRRFQVNGTVAPGFESVEQLFENQMQALAERNAQLCAYHRGEKVVDLWGSKEGDSEFSSDSLINVFSSGKSLEAIAIAWLADKGLLSYEAEIIQYWPEFGAQGKDKLTVADLMRHEAGLANFDTSIDMEDLFAEQIKQNAVGKIIEGHSLAYTSSTGGKREYHALTRGWIANELFRRVDPAGRTIGEFLHEEISGPLDADVMIGVPEDQMARMSKVHDLGFGRQLLLSLRPKFLGRRIVHNIFQILGRLIRIVPSMAKSRKAGAPPPLTGMTNLDIFNEPNFAKGETPSANATCSARGLAKVAAMMSAGGKFEGKEFIGEPAWKAMHEHPLKATMGGMLTTRFTQGGVDCFTLTNAQSTRAEREFNEGREGFYGWMGLGGSIFQWHPELDIGFAFVPTSLHTLDLFNERGKRFQAEVLQCVKNSPAQE
ncbi:MAG: serine hydrolase domain-containing protein [Halioglobus sp.]